MNLLSPKRINLYHVTSHVQIQPVRTTTTKSAQSCLASQISTNAKSFLSLMNESLFFSRRNEMKNRWHSIVTLFALIFFTNPSYLHLLYCLSLYVFLASKAKQVIFLKVAIFNRQGKCYSYYKVNLLSNIAVSLTLKSGYAHDHLKSCEDRPRNTVASIESISLTIAK